MPNTAVLFKESGKPKKPGRMLKGLRTNFPIYAMLSPTIILTLLFTLYPILYVLFFSFTEYDGFHPPVWAGLSNYLRVFQDVSWWETVLNTIEIGLISSAVILPLALFFAVILNGKLQGKNTFRALFFLPNITSAAVMGVIFYFIFSTSGGYVNELLKLMGLIRQPIDFFATGFLAKTVIIIFRVWAGTGFYMILFLAALQRIPFEVYESASLDGAGPWSTFFKITVPMLGRMFQVISGLLIIDAMKLYDSVRALTNGAPAGKSEVMTMYIFSYFFEGGGGGSFICQQGYASAISIVATLIISVISVIYLLSTRNVGNEE